MLTMDDFWTIFCAVIAGIATVRVIDSLTVLVFRAITKRDNN